MEKKKTITLTLIGMFIFLFGVIGLTYAYWNLNLKQEDENLVYSDCLRLSVSWGEKGFELTDAYPMTNEDLVSDFFPNHEPYQFTIENICNNDIPVSINMESLIATEPQLKDDYVDVILWENDETETNVFVQGTDTVLSHQGSRDEIGSEEPKPSYKLTDNKENSNKLIADAKTAYQLYKFKLPANATKSFNLLLFMDYDTPVDGTLVDGVEVHTNNANWAGKITLNNYEIPKVNIAGKEVELVEEGDGLYAVEHTGVDIKDENGEKVEGWDQTEYRYAGANPNNYVTFNDEKWRIIGLVNVLIPQEDGSEKVEQRVKVIRSESIGQYSWDNKSEGTGSSTSNYGSNDWTDSQLMEMLNDKYYYSSSNFSGTDTGTKGLEASARDMIDKEIIWNLGGAASYYSSSTGLVTHWYGYERGTKVPSGRQTTWSSSNTKKPATEVGAKSQIDTELFHSVGLMYPSDYGYATSGGSKGRALCLATEISSWDSMTDCGNNDWLKPASGWMWTLSPKSSSFDDVVYVSSDGYVSYYYAYYSNGVWPALYLSSKVSLSGGTEDSEYPLGSEQNPFTLIMK